MKKSLSILLLMLCFCTAPVLSQTRSHATDVRQVKTYAELRTLAPSSTLADSMVGVMGIAATGDGGQGTFQWSNTSTATDDNGSVILPTGHTGAGRWLRIKPQGANVFVSSWFPTLAEAVSATPDQCKLLVDRSYSNLAPITITGKQITIEGSSLQGLESTSTSLTFTGNGFLASGSRGLTLRYLTIKGPGLAATSTFNLLAAPPTTGNTGVRFYNSTSTGYRGARIESCGVHGFDSGVVIEGTWYNSVVDKCRLSYNNNNLLFFSVAGGGSPNTSYVSQTNSESANILAGIFGGTGIRFSQCHFENSNAINTQGVNLLCNDDYPNSIGFLKAGTGTVSYVGGWLETVNILSLGGSFSISDVNTGGNFVFAGLDSDISLRTHAEATTISKAASSYNASDTDVGYTYYNVSATTATNLSTTDNITLARPLPYTPGYRNIMIGASIRFKRVHPATIGVMFPYPNITLLQPDYQVGSATELLNWRTSRINAVIPYSLVTADEWHLFKYYTPVNFTNDGSISGVSNRWFLNNTTSGASASYNIADMSLEFLTHISVTRAP